MSDSLFPKVSLDIRELDLEGANPTQTSHKCSTNPTQNGHGRIALDLTVAEVDFILNNLSKLPYEQVHLLILKILQQAQNE